MDRVLAIDSDVMGVGDRALGLKLISTFLKMLCARHEKPRTVILYNSGVKLACEGSPVIDYFTHLVNDGVELLLCGTCIDYYKLRESVLVGEISNMGTIQDRVMTGNVFKP